MRRMKMALNSRFAGVIVWAVAQGLSACASSDNQDKPIPGTLQSTDSKNSENNTPQTNPTPNPEPASNPPGPASDYHPVSQ